MAERDHDIDHRPSGAALDAHLEAQIEAALRRRIRSGRGARWAIVIAAIALALAGMFLWLITDAEVAAPRLPSRFAEAVLHAMTPPSPARGPERLRAP